MNFTFIYVAINKSMPNMVKIGCTRRNPNERIEELDSTGIPTPFEVSFVACVEDAPKLEKLVHSYLVNHRVREKREFFHLTVQNARKSILEVANANKIEIFFAKTNEHLQKQNNSTKNNLYLDKNAFHIIEIGFFEALNSLNYKKTIELFIDNIDYFIDDVIPSFNLHNRHLYDNYCRKIKICGNDDFDLLFQTYLPKIYKQITFAQCYSLFFYARYTFQLDHSSKAIALESFRKARNKSELIESAVFFYLSGQENDAEKVLHSNLPGYENEIDFNAKYFLGSYRKYLDALFLFTGLQIKKYELTKEKPAEFYFSYAKAIINGLPRKFSIFFHQQEHDENWRGEFNKIAFATNKFVEQHDFLSYSDFKLLLAKYFSKFDVLWIDNSN